MLLATDASRGSSRYAQLDLALVAGTVLAQTLLNIAALVALASVLVASVALFATGRGQ